MDPFLESTCAQTIWHDKWQGGSSDGRGSPQFANAPTSYAARIEPDTQVIMQPDGTRATSTHKIVTPAVVDERDRIYLADPAGSAKPRRILRLRELPDEFGAHDHCEIWV